MGQTDKFTAIQKLSGYISVVKGVRSCVKDNFEEMDIENVNRRDEIEGFIQEIIDKCDTIINDLESITFE